MCLICKKNDDSMLCDNCVSIENIEHICSALCGAPMSMPETLSQFVKGINDKTDRAKKALELCDMYPMYDTLYCKLQAYNKLGKEYYDEIICGVPEYIKTHDIRSRNVIMIHILVDVLMHKLDLYDVIKWCDILFDQYNDPMSLYDKAEAYLKLWQMDKAVTTVNKCVSELMKIKRGVIRGERSTEPHLDMHIASAKKRLHEYKEKRGNGYFYVPEDQDAREKLIQILNNDGISTVGRLFMFDTTFSIKTFVSFDLETTGIGTFDGITEIGAVKVIDGEIVSHYSQLINPGKMIPQRIIDLTGISNEMVEKMPKIEQVFGEFLEFCDGLPLVAHNASFDLRYLTKEADKHGILINVPVIDTLSLARTVWPYLERYKLTYLTEHFNIPQTYAHRAWCDAEATARLYLLMIEEYEKQLSEQDD